MPSVNYGADEFLQRFFRGLTARVSALELQQNWAVRDTAGNVRVRAGLLDEGLFGLSVADPSLGNVTDFLPVYEQQLSTRVNTSSASYVTLSGPSVTATIGANGQALITATSFLIPPAVKNGAQGTAVVGIGIDGSAPNSLLTNLLVFGGVNANASTISLSSTVSAAVIVSGLTAGQHTFKMLYASPWGGSSTFGHRLLQVRPL